MQVDLYNGRKTVVVVVPVIINSVSLSLAATICSHMYIGMLICYSVVLRGESGWGDKEFEVESILDHYISEVWSRCLYSHLYLLAFESLSLIKL